MNNNQPKGKAPAFQFYAQDFLMGTLDFNTEEVGAYIRLLANQWDKGGLVDDLDKLLGLAGISRKRRNALNGVLAKFEKCEDGMLRNARLEKERKKTNEFRAGCSIAGKVSASKRGNKFQPSANERSTGVATDAQQDTNVAPNVTTNEQPNAISNGHSNSTSNGDPTLQFQSSSSFSSSDYFKKEGSAFEKSFNAGDDTGPVWKPNPTADDMGELPAEVMAIVIERLKATRHIVVTEQQVVSCWDVFKKMKLDGQGNYRSQQNVYNHFGNWMRNENFTLITQQLSAYGGYISKHKDPPPDPRWKKMMERYGK